MIVKELIQKTDCASVAHIWNEFYRFDREEPYDEEQLAKALHVHLEMLLRFQPVLSQGMIRARPEVSQEGKKVQVYPCRFGEEAPWPDSVEEILGLTILQNNPDEQTVIAAILHQIFFKNQQGSERQENIA